MMYHKCELSNVAKEYLNTFYCILDQMIIGMTDAELCDSISHNFIVQMIPHHRAAIEMSENLLKYTTCIPLQNIALQIIKEQTESIENMQEALCECSQVLNPNEVVEVYQCKVDEILNQMFSAMENAPGTNQINANFMREMIPHHKGAIALSRHALCSDICPELEPILEAIIVSQEKGVRQMEQLLRSIGYYK